MSERYNRSITLYSVAEKILRPILKTPRAALMYTINRNWREIVGEEFFNFTEVENVTLLRNQKTANLYIVSFNSAVSFYVNNNKTHILDKINNFFGYRAVLDLYVKEVPRIVPKISEKYSVDEVKLNKFISNNNITDMILREKLNELAKEVYSTPK
jgi:hypothetical protein